MESVGVDSLWTMARLLNVTQPQHGVLAALLGAIVVFQLTTAHAVTASTIEIPVSVTTYFSDNRHSVPLMKQS